MAAKETKRGKGKRRGNDHPIRDQEQAQRLRKAITEYGTYTQLAKDVKARRGDRGSLSRQRIGQLVKNPYTASSNALLLITSVTRRKGHDYNWVLCGLTFKEDQERRDRQQEEREMREKEAGEGLAEQDKKAANCIATAFCALGREAQTAIASTTLALLRGEMTAATHAQRRLLVTSALEHCEVFYEDYFTFIDWNELEKREVPDEEEDDAWFDKQEQEEERLGRVYDEYAREVYGEISGTLRPYCSVGESEDRVCAPWDGRQRTEHPQRKRRGGF